MTETTAKNADLRAAIINRLSDYPALNLHLVSAHFNGAGLGLTEAEALDEHTHEHRGPGTIRNHDASDLFWDPEKVADVIIECAEEWESDPVEHASEIATLMQRPNVVVAMSATEHTHDEVLDEPWTVCPQAETCRVYPRTYDAVRETTPDGASSHSSSSTEVTSEAEDIYRGIRSAQAALRAALTADKTNPRSNPALEETLTAGQEQLQHSLMLLVSRLGGEEPTPSS